MARGNQYDFVPGYDYGNNIQQVGMFYWDTNALSYVRWSGSATTPDVAIANFPAVTTVTGSLTTSPPDITTVTYATSLAVGITGGFVAATQNGAWAVGVTGGNVAATQSGSWVVYVASVTAVQGAGGASAWPVTFGTGSWVFATSMGQQGISGNVGATQSGNWAVGVTGGNVAATQSGVWNVGINSGSLVAIASGQGVGISGSVVASLSGTNYIIATLSTSSSIVGGVYPVSGLVMNERANIVPGSISFGNATTTGYITLIAAQGSGILTRVLSVHCMSQDYNTVALFSGINGTGSTITSTKPVAPYGGWVGNFNPQGWCETGANQALSFYQSVATATGIDVTWATTS